MASLIAQDCGCLDLVKQCPGLRAVLDLCTRHSGSGLLGLDRPCKQWRFFDICYRYAIHNLSQGNDSRFASILIIDSHANAAARYLKTITAEILEHARRSTLTSEKSFDIVSIPLASNTVMKQVLCSKKTLGRGLPVYWYMPAKLWFPRSARSPAAPRLHCQELSPATKWASMHENGSSVQGRPRNGAAMHDAARPANR